MSLVATNCSVWICEVKAVLGLPVLGLRLARAELSVLRCPTPSEPRDSGWAQAVAHSSAQASSHCIADPSETTETTKLACGWVNISQCYSAWPPRMTKGVGSPSYSPPNFQRSQRQRWKSEFFGDAFAGI